MAYAAPAVGGKLRRIVQGAMSIFTPHRYLDRFGLPLLIVLATLASWALREWAQYPPTPSDERNWIAIAAQVANGVNWPISGPLHFESTQALAAWTEQSHEEALALLGLASVPAVLLAYAASYRLMGFAQAWPPILLLCASPYFWAPLIESRPQQWGQGLVMLCTTSAWQLLTQTNNTTRPHKMVMWLAWSVLFTLTCWVHLLSGAVAWALCLMLCFGLASWKRGAGSEVFACCAAMLPGLTVLLLPDGPYQTMWNDILAHHLRFHVASFITPAILIAACGGFFVHPLKKGVSSAAHYLLTCIEAKPIGWAFVLAAGVILPMGVQVILLPSDAWIHYRHAWLAVFPRQLGNLFFLCLFITGLVLIAHNPIQRLRASWSGQMMVLTCTGTLALLALLTSTVLLHTNWMLRVTYYALPMAAPFAAAGFYRWRLAAQSKAVLLGIVATLSLASVGWPSWRV